MVADDNCVVLNMHPIISSSDKAEVIFINIINYGLSFRKRNGSKRNFNESQIVVKVLYFWVHEPRLFIQKSCLNLIHFRDFMTIQIMLLNSMDIFSFIFWIKDQEH